MAATAGPNIVQNGLSFFVDVADLKSYPGSGATLTDLSINKYTGTLINSPTFSSINQGGLVFNPVFGQYCTTTLGGWPSDFTLEVAINTSSVSSKQTVTGNYSGAAGGGLEIIASAQWNFFVWNSGGVYAAVTVGTLSTSTNYIVTCTKLGTAMTLYQNSRQLGTATLTSSVINQSQPVYIAKDYAQSLYYNGTVYYVKIYSRALSQAEITQNFNAHRGRFGL
jgi:hypothetical protein